MDDLMDNFADANIESPTEEVYIHHFINGSPVASEHERPTAAFSAKPSGRDPFFDDEAADSHQATARNEDEGDYNADIDDDDEPGHERYHKDLTSALGDYVYPFPNDDCDQFEERLVNGGATDAVAYPSLATSGDEQDSNHGFSQHLLRLHRQDSERDELLTVCTSFRPSPLGLDVC